MKNGLLILLIGLPLFALAAECNDDYTVAFGETMAADALICNQGTYKITRLPANTTVLYTATMTFPDANQQAQITVTFGAGQTVNGNSEDFTVDISNGLPLTLMTTTGPEGEFYLQLENNTGAAAQLQIQR